MVAWASRYMEVLSSFGIFPFNNTPTITRLEALGIQKPFTEVKMIAQQHRNSDQVTHSLTQL